MSKIVENNMKVAESIVSDYSLNVDYFDNDVLIVVDNNYLFDNFDKIFGSSYFGSSSDNNDDVWDNCRDTVLNAIDYLFEDNEELNNILSRVKNDNNFIAEYNDEAYSCELYMGRYNEEVLIERLVESVEG